MFAGKDIEYCEPFLESVRLAVESYRMALRDSQHRPESKKAAEQRRGVVVKAGVERLFPSLSVSVSPGGTKIIKNRSKC